MPVSVSSAGISLTLSTCGHSPYLIYDEQRERSPDFCHLHFQYFPTPPSLRDTSPIFCMAKHPRKATGHGREEVLNTTPMMSFQSLAILRKEYEISSNATIQQGEKIKMVIPISTQGQILHLFPVSLTSPALQVTSPITSTMSKRERRPDSVTSTAGIFQPLRHCVTPPLYFA